MQQLVEVAKAISIDAKLLIMDEPTSSLSEKEIDELFKVISDLRNQGLGDHLRLSQALRAFHDRRPRDGLA